jgi:carbon monoxide dehydrogenase subunit G
VQLTNTFTVPVPVERAWQVLLDAERVAPCLPGASVDQVDGDDVHGRVAARLGPIHVQYQGTVSFVERDELAHRAVLHASAKESRGDGTARATIAASLAPDGDATTVTVVTDLAITGKPAQFGRGVVADVSRHLVGQFARNLASEIESGRLAVATDGEAAPADSAGPAPSAGSAGSAGSRPVEPAAGAGLPVLGLVWAATRRMVVPFAVGIVAGWLVGRSGTRRRAC